MIKKIPAGKSLPFSLSTIHNHRYIMEISGQIGLRDGSLAFSIDEQTHIIMQNIRSIVAQVGWTLDNLTKVRIYLTSMDDYATVNSIYSSYFTKGYPARVAIAVKALPMQANIEIDCTAAGEIQKNN